MVNLVLFEYNSILPSFTISFTRKFRVYRNPYGNYIYKKSPRTLFLVQYISASGPLLFFILVKMRRSRNLPVQS